MKRICAALLLLLSGTAWAQQPESLARTLELDTVVVVGITPVAGTTLRRSEVPGNLQVVDAERFESSLSLDLTDFIRRNLASVNVNEPGGNPLQPDLNYRGFTASPLLGLPQGLAVYQDGVRVNELFADVVNWDLLPEAATERLELVPGSNPVFGLNTLGGAISLRTRSGFSAPGHHLSLFGGRFGRVLAEVSSGGHNERFAYFVSGNFFREDGWRDFSSSQATQLFGKVSYAEGGTALDFSTTLAQSDLRGNGATPVQLLAQDRAAVFTHPDNTRNQLALFNLEGSLRLAPGVRLSGNLYARLKNTDTFNGDDSPYDVVTGDDGVDRLIVEEEGDDDDEEEFEEDDLVVDQNGNLVVADESNATATNNTSATDETSFGLTAQVTVDRPVADRRNQLTVGTTAETGRADFSAQTELARLTDDRGTVGSGIIDGNSFTEVEASVQRFSAYVFNAFSPTDRLTLTAGGRFNYANLVLDDQLGTALNGDHTFTRFNPSAGASYRWDKLSAFLSYNVATRTPTPVELTCADPEAPCRLPNAFLADPPLDQVVAGTFEGGLRGRLPYEIDWVLSAFRTDVSDDIYFISAGPARNSGFFDNIGQTRRQGVEVSLQRQTGELRWYAHYTYLEATFQENFSVNSPFHPEAEDGEIEISAGNFLPLIPNHIVKLGAIMTVTERLMLGSDLTYTGGFFIRGDEANLLDRVDGYTLLGLRGEYQVAEFLSTYFRVSNLLNTEYETMGLLGEPDEIDAETPNGGEFEDFDNPRFLTPGTPFFFRIGFELSL